VIPTAELERLERVRAGTLALVDGLSQEDLDRQPAGGGWSVGEILDHLLRAEAANRDTPSRTSCASPPPTRNATRTRSGRPPASSVCAVTPHRPRIRKERRAP
jgi:hypothetical protein